MDMAYNMNGRMTNTHTLLLKDFGGNHLGDLDIDGRILQYI
jgi:hypothetical protein